MTQKLKLKFEQTWFELIYPIFVMPLLTGLIIYASFQSFLSAIVIFFLILIAVALNQLLTFTTVILNEKGILIKNILKKRRVDWEEIVSMATVNNLSGFLRYEIKTKNFKAAIPMPKKWQEFEQQVINKAGLELAGENAAVVYKLGSPGIKRWKKPGEEYAVTSFRDWVNGMGYLDGKKWFKKSMLGVLFFVLGLISILLLYLLNTGRL